jgi:RNA polymerase sigma-70 factor, ECF subfamily
MGSTPPVQVGAAAGSDAAVDFGLAETFEQFYRREMPALVAFARALSGAACAEDLAQDAMITAYRRWDVVSHFDVPSAWVRRVCANRAVSTWRRGTVEARALLRLGARRCLVEPIAADHEAFWAEVRRLPRRQAQVIALHYLYDLDIAGIATTLGCAEGTVKVHLSRGRTALATRFDSYGEVRS